MTRGQRWMSEFFPERQRIWSVLDGWRARVGLTRNLADKSPSWSPAAESTMSCSSGLRSLSGLVAATEWRRQSTEG